MIRKGLVAVVLLVAACRALPSTVPLSDSAPPDTDDWVPSRRALAVADDGDSGDDEDDDAVDADEIAVTASGPDKNGSSAAEKPAETASAEAGDAGVGEAAWPGEYFGSDRFVWRGADGREAVEVDDRAHTRVERGGSSGLVITIVNSMTGEDICALDAAASGKEARVREGESCFGSPGREAIVTDGLATLEGDRLVLDFKGRIEAGDEDDEEEEAGAEEGAYHFDGRRR